MPMAICFAASPNSLFACSQDPAATGRFGERRITGPVGVGSDGPASRNSMIAAMNSVLAEPFGHTMSARATMNTNATTPPTWTVRCGSYSKIR